MKTIKNIEEAVGSGMVNLAVLSPESRLALEQYSSQHGYDDWLGGRWIESHWLSWLIALLKEEPNTPELFPKGKSATIQRLQDLEDMAAKYEIQHRGDAI